LTLPYALRPWFAKHQHVDDADIEGKLKKMMARANDLKNRKPLAAVSETAADGAS
jgi:hypothetical protein